MQGQQQQKNQQQQKMGTAPDVTLTHVCLLSSLR